MPNSKAKGSAYERQIARDLTNWMGGNAKDEYWCYRCPQSGGLGTIMAKSQNMSGDLISCHENSKYFFDIFSVEAKNGYSGAKFSALLKDNKNKTILDFWSQSLRDAVKSNRLPLVIYKNGSVNWIAVCDTFLNLYTDIDPNISKLNTLKFKGEYKDSNYSINFYNYTKFFELVTYENIQKIKLTNIKKLGE